MEFGRKRGRFDATFAGNGGFKKSRDEMDTFTTGVGSKSKPCMKFYSTSGCSFGDACHFLHHVPGYSAQTQLTNFGGNAAIPTGRNAHFTDGAAPSVKNKLCNKVNTPEGCRFGDKCHFAHSEMELKKPGYEEARSMGSMNRLSQHFEPYPPSGNAANFGTSATAKISIDASFAGPIIGKNGVNSKQICRLTGVKLSIRDHETDPEQRNIELEGTFDQINQASAMVQDLILNISASKGGAEKPPSTFGRGVPQNRVKRRMCENFSKGLCTYGERCHFAHADSELGK